MKTVKVLLFGFLILAIFYIARIGLEVKTGEFYVQYKNTALIVVSDTTRGIITTDYYEINLKRVISHNVGTVKFRRIWAKLIESEIKVENHYYIDDNNEKRDLFSVLSDSPKE